jgi:hypothetical protein
MKIETPLQTKKIELTRLPVVKSLLRSRWPQFALRALALAGFLLAILAGLLGTPVGSHNFAIVFVWIAWWALLMLALVPFLGRGWCSICPIPMPGEWLQQGSVLKPQAGGTGFGKRWPNKLRNIWLQNGTFAMVALFSTLVLTQPNASALVLAAFLFIATGASLVFERRAFCRYLCPVGGFIGLYSQLAPLELRVKDRTVCAGHVEKTCYTGNENGYGCPWQVFPGGMIKNTYCGLCMECLRTCPHDNIALNFRSLGADLEPARGRKMDEAFKAFLMLGSALVYAGVMLGPWGALKNSAYNIGSLAWLLYALVFLTFVFGIVPAIFWLAVRSGRTLAGVHENIRGTSMRRDFIQLAYSLVPLGLTAWIAFSLAFVFTNLSYLWPALSDPFGWGWNLFGTASAAWTPYLAGLIPSLQAVILLAGLAWASHTALKIAYQIVDGYGMAEGTREQAVSAAVTRLALPVVAFCLAVTAGMMGLLLA